MIQWGQITLRAGHRQEKDIYKMTEEKLALEGVNNTELEQVLRESEYKEVYDFLAKATKACADVGDACLNNDTIYTLVDGRCLVVVWTYANEWANTPNYRGV